MPGGTATMASSAAAPDSNGIATGLTSTSFDSDGFINISGVSLKYYKWSPETISTPLTYEQLIAVIKSSSLSATISSYLAGRPTPGGPPSTDALIKGIGTGAVGIFKESIAASAQYSPLSSGSPGLDEKFALMVPGASFSSPGIDAGSGMLELYSAIDTSDTPFEVLKDLTDETASSTQMTMDIVYSGDELAALDEKYGYIPSGETVAVQINSKISAMALDLLQTFSNNKLTQNKAYSKTRLSYRDIASLTGIERASNVNISAIASEEIVAATESSTGFNFSTTLNTDSSDAY